MAMSLVMALSMVSTTALQAFADEANAALSEAQGLVYGNVYGVVNDHAMVVIDKQVYEDVYGNETSYPLCAYDVNVYDENGNSVISTSQYSSGDAIPCRDSKAGYAISVRSFYELNGLLAVARDGGAFQGVVDLDGNAVIDLNYSSLQYFTDRELFIGLKWVGDEAVIDMLSRTGKTVYTQSLGKVKSAGLSSWDEYFRVMDGDVFKIYTTPLEGSEQEESYWKVQDDGSLIASDSEAYEKQQGSAHSSYPSWYKKITDDRYLDRMDCLIRDAQGEAVSDRLVSGSCSFIVADCKVFAYQKPNVSVFDKDGALLQTKDLSTLLTEPTDNYYRGIKLLTRSVIAFENVALTLDLDRIDPQYVLSDVAYNTYADEITVDGVEHAYTYYAYDNNTHSRGTVYVVNDLLVPLENNGRKLAASSRLGGYYGCGKPTVPYDGSIYYMVLGDNGKIGMTSSSGEQVLPFEYDDYFYPEDNSASYVLVKKDEAWSFLNLKNLLGTVDPIDISAASITASDVTYDGKSAVVPALTVTDGDKALVEGTDYKVSSIDYDLSAGTGTAVVEGVGSYSGKVVATFAAATPDSLRFPDVAQPEWYFESCAFAKANGLISGYENGDFGPADTLTRAQAAAILQRYFAPAEADAYVASDAANATGMADVADGQWYTGAANWAVREGVINGVKQGDGSRLFDPYGVITREQLCAIVGNAAAKWCGAIVEGADRAKLYGLLGADMVSDWAVDSVAWGVNAGVVNGVATEAGRDVAASAAVERSVMAAVMMNAIQNDVIRR